MKAYSTPTPAAQPMGRSAKARAGAAGASRTAQASVQAELEEPADAWASSEASADAVKALADRMGIPVSAWPIVGPRPGPETDAHFERHTREDERLAGVHRAWREEERLNGKSRRAAELYAELGRGERLRSLARRDISEKVVRAERDASRRGELFAAVRRMLSQAAWPNCGEAEYVVRMVTVLLDAGRSLSLSEESARERGRWGSGSTEGALYAAKYAGVVREDMYGVVSLVRPVDAEVPMGEEWMYGALEKAVRCGAARYTDSGIEVHGGSGALTPRELAGAEAVAAGVNEYGEPPGLGAWLRESPRGGEAITWAEATVISRGADAEVGEAYARLVARGRAPAEGSDGAAP